MDRLLLGLSTNQNDLRDIQSLPEDTHWFCPRNSLDDGGLYYPEDVQGNPHYEDNISTEERTSEVVKANSRKAQVFEALQIFAFDGKDAAQYQDWLEEHLGEQMRRCDVCVREFHRGRKSFKEQLNELVFAPLAHRILTPVVFTMRMKSMHSWKSSTSST